MIFGDLDIADDTSIFYQEPELSSGQMSGMGPQLQEEPAPPVRALDFEYIGGGRAVPRPVLVPESTYEPSQETLRPVRLAPLVPRAAGDSPIGEASGMVPLSVTTVPEVLYAAPKANKYYRIGSAPEVYEYGTNRHVSADDINQDQTYQDSAWSHIDVLDAMPGASLATVALPRTRSEGYRPAVEPIGEIFKPLPAIVEPQELAPLPRSMATAPEAAASKGWVLPAAIAAAVTFLL